MDIAYIIAYVNWFFAIIRFVIMTDFCDDYTILVVLCTIYIWNIFSPLFVSMLFYMYVRFSGRDWWALYVTYFGGWHSWPTRCFISCFIRHTLSVVLFSVVSLWLHNTRLWIPYFIFLSCFIEYFRSWMKFVFRLWYDLQTSERCDTLLISWYFSHVL